VGDDGIVPDQEQVKLTDAWNAAVRFTDVKTESVERALFRGVNIRVAFPEAFIAGYELVKAGAAIAAATAVHGLVPLAIWESYVAAHAVFGAMVEKMTPLEYVTAVILAQHKDGIEEATLADEVNAFLEDPNTRKFGWHVGMTEKRVEEARADRYEGWVTQTLKDLQGEFLSKEGTLLRPKQKNVEYKIGF
jgi:hypothetical protein